MTINLEPYQFKAQLLSHLTTGAEIKYNKFFFLNSEVSAEPSADKKNTKGDQTTTTNNTNDKDVKVEDDLANLDPKVFFL